MESKSLIELRSALMDGNAKLTAELADTALREEIKPIVIMDTLVEALRIVGDEYGKGIRFLPELVASAEAMQKVSTKIEEELKKFSDTRKVIGTVVIGTVLGDIHTIGKSLVTALLTAEGFKVHDLGIDVKTETFLNSVINIKPDVLAMSALLTTTAPEARKVIEQLKKENIRDRVKVIVGGGAITDKFAKSIGADGYDATAPGAVSVVKNLLRL
jgi:5-methyltetrahydrofolate--homocysteine methyltransferase